MDTPGRQSQGQVTRLGLGQPLVISSQDAQETQALGNGHQDDVESISASMERGDQTCELIEVAAGRFE